MIVLTINNSECSVIGLSVSQFKELRDILSYESGQYSSYKTTYNRPTKTYLISQKGAFASGLLHYVEKYLWDNKITHTTKVLSKRPNAQGKLFTMTLGLTPYPEQLAISEASSIAGRGTISAVTAFGKSISMALLVNRLQVRTLIIVPTLGLKTQLTNSFKEYFGSLKNITIENIDSPSLKTHTDYDCLIIDEAHHVAAKTYRKLNKTAWKGIYYRFFFTATPFRGRDEEQLLFESIAGQVIYTVDYHTAVSKGYICPVEAYYVEVPSTQIKGNQKSWASMYSELVVNNKIRNDLIIHLLLTFHANKRATICLVKEILQGTNLVKSSLPLILPFTHSESDTGRIDLLSFLLQETPVLIGTTGVLGEGVDTKPAEFIIIAGLGKSKPQLMQQVGRGLRVYPGKESCKVILFYDKSHAWTKKHFKIQCKILLDEYGVVPSKLDIT